MLELGVERQDLPPELRARRESLSRKPPSRSCWITPPTNIRWCRTSAGGAPSKCSRVDEVISANPQSSEVVHFEPFYSYRHASVNAARRRPSGAHAPPVGLPRRRGHRSLPLAGGPLLGARCAPDVDTLTVRTAPAPIATCPSRLPFGNEAGDFELEGGCRDQADRGAEQADRRAASAVGQGRPVAPDLAALAELSLAGGGWQGGVAGDSAALQFHRAPPIPDKQIDGFTGLDSRRHFARVISEDGIVFARGTQVEMEFDEEQFVGGGVYLFATVLEYFLGLYVIDEQLQPAPCADAAEKGDAQTVATPGGSEDTAVDARGRDARNGCSSGALPASSSSRRCA